MGFKLKNKKLTYKSKAKDITSGTGKKITKKLLKRKAKSIGRIDR